MSKNVIVVGAGASGLMAAIKAAEYGGRVTILEQNGLPGRKLLVTGNGRCNLTNTNQSRECYHCSNSFFPLPAIAAFGQQETVQFFSKLGIYTVNRGGYLYPHSGQASQVLGVLTMEAKARGVKIRCNTGVKAVTRMNPGQHKVLPEGGYAVRVEGYTYYCDALILANGSPASSVEGACDSGYALAKSLGHTIIRPEPALVPLVTREKYPWHGVRTEGKVTLYVENTSVAESEGELQLTSYGISGIPVFQVSREAARALGDGQSVTACLDFFPDFDPERVRVSVLESLLAKTVTGGTKAKDDGRASFDWASYDMHVAGALRLNEKLLTQADVYYFSVPCSASVADKDGVFHPNRRAMEKHIVKSGAQMGLYAGKTRGGFPLGPEWRENDGLVNTLSARAPLFAPQTDFVPGKIRPGVWNVMPVYPGDHMSLQGGLAHVRNVRPFYEALLAMLKHLPE